MVNKDYEPVKIETNKYSLAINGKGLVRLFIIFNKAKNDIRSINFNLADVIYFTRVPKGEYNFAWEFSVTLKYNVNLSLYFSEDDNRIKLDKLVNTLEAYLVTSLENRGGQLV